MIVTPITVTIDETRRRTAYWNVAIATLPQLAPSRIGLSPHSLGQPTSQHQCLPLLRDRYVNEIDILKVDTMRVRGTGPRVAPLYTTPSGWGCHPTRSESEEHDLSRTLLTKGKRQSISSRFRKQSPLQCGLVTSCIPLHRRDAPPGCA